MNPKQRMCDEIVTHFCHASQMGFGDHLCKLATHGYEGIELRCRYNPEDPDAEPSNWGRHLTDVSPDNIAAKAAQIRDLSQQTGVRVCALAPNFTCDQTEIIDKIFNGALAIDPDNPPLIRIGAQRHDRSRPYLPQFLDARAGFAHLVERAHDCGVKIIYEIHVGTIAVSASRAIELLNNFDPNHIGAIFDVPNMIRVGLEDSKMGLELLGPYLAHVHIGNATPVQTQRDATGSMHWQWGFLRPARRHGRYPPNRPRPQGRGVSGLHLARRIWPGRRRREDQRRRGVFEGVDGVGPPAQPPSVRRKTEDGSLATSGVQLP